jgi:hypothetical protein
MVKEAMLYGKLPDHTVRLVSHLRLNLYNR